MHTEFEWSNLFIGDHHERRTMAIQTDVEENDYINWIRIMAGGRFYTVGVKPSDSVSAVFCRHLFKPEV